MQSAFDGMYEFAPTVTSVMSGQHEKDSAHYAGRAVDVGAFGGTQVGLNEPTWDAIVGAIESGRFSKIGTMGVLAQNPRLQAFAKANGVTLFVDEGSGPHVHFEVPP